MKFSEIIIYQNDNKFIEVTASSEQELIDLIKFAIKQGFVIRIQ